jgi:hypothetical protein
LTLATYADLLSGVADWLQRTDLTARIPDFVTLAEAQMNRTLRVRRMEARATASLSEGLTALPADFLEAITLTLADGTKLDPVPTDVMADYSELSAESGAPRFFGLMGEGVQAYPAPDRPYDVTLTYYARIPALSVSTPGNWVLSQYPDAYLYGTLLQAGPYLRDSEATGVWGALQASALEAIKAETRTPAGKLRTEPGLAGSHHHRGL